MRSLAQVIKETMPAGTRLIELPVWPPEWVIQEPLKPAANQVFFFVLKMEQN